jgi:hypothetical protein
MNEQNSAKVWFDPFDAAHDVAQGSPAICGAIVFVSGLSTARLSARIIYLFQWTRILE